MTIEWNKIVTNAISALVVTTFLGAATIVWKGATSVDTKVQSTREDMTHLIDALSDKLGGYEVQIVSLSNQLAVVIANQTAVNSVYSKKLGNMFGTTSQGNLLGSSIVTSTPNPIVSYAVKPEPPVVPAESYQQLIQQKAYSQDIQKQLKR